MAKVMRAVIGLVAGYAIGVLCGAIAVQLLSGNSHDKSVEMAMTAAFVTGPIGAILGLLAALLWKRRADGGPDRQR